MKLENSHCMHNYGSCEKHEIFAENSPKLANFEPLVIGYKLKIWHAL